MLSKLGRPEESLQACRTVLRVAAPSTPPHRLAEVINEMGRTLIVLGQPEEALANAAGFSAATPAKRPSSGT